MSYDEIKKVFTRYKTVAIVGLSRDSLKDSYRVGEYLKKNGFHIVPVNPYSNETLGEKSYKSLIDMPAEVQRTLEIVDIFRPSEEVLPIVSQVVRLKELYDVPYVVWMQLGIINEQAAEKARNVGLIVVMDKCMMQEHMRLFTQSELQGESS